MDTLQHVVDSLQAIIDNQSKESALVQTVAWYALIPFALAFAFVIFIIYRSKREAKFRQKEAELNRQISEVEMKALRSQLNPHFIFNCLNSIHAFVHANENASAGDYLVKFSKLMRLVLENSVSREVPLEDDLEALKMYIELEKMRMKNSFTYEFVVEKDIDPATVLVPPLIVQPFVENSIWHGLNGLKNSGKIVIRINRSGEMLRYIVEDNGVQSVKPPEEKIVKGKRKSLGMSLTRERLEILNKTKGTNASFTLTDLKDAEGKYAGKIVELLLPYEED